MPQLSRVTSRPSARPLHSPAFAYRAFLLLVLFATVVAALPAAAQSDQSEWQLYGGTSFLWAKTSPYAQQLHLDTLHEFGWQTDISQYPWHWFGGTLESSGFYGRPNVFDPRTNQTYSDLFSVKSYTIMFGPTFAYLRNPRFQPFGHVLLGGVYRSANVTSKGASNDIIVGQTLNPSQWIFGWALGGGADVSINRLVAIRGQVDWLPTTFKNFYNDRQENLRVSLGLVFRFGGEDSKRGALKPLPPAPPADSSGMAGNATPGDQEPIAHSAPPVTSTVAQNFAPHLPPPALQNSASATTTAKAQSTVMSPPAPEHALQNQNPPPASQETALAAQPATAPASLQPGGASANPPVVPAPVPDVVPPAQQAMVEFWSRPTGADVEVDGQYVGSTFSTIALPPGEHTITIRKQDFATWQRTIRVTYGSVRVAAYLEQVRATVTFH